MIPVHTAPSPAVPPVLTLPPLQAKFHALRSDLYAINVNRTVPIDVVTLALAVGGAHVLMLGKPGTGKTRFVKQVMARIGGAKLFSILMGKLTDLCEVRGPMSVKQFQNDVLAYLGGDFLPGADVAYLDEVMKAGIAVLNHMLGEMEGGHVSTVLGTSNEPGDPKELAAFIDRFLFTVDVEELTDPEHIRQMLCMARNERLNPAAAPAPILTWADVEAAKAEVRATPVSDDAVEGLVEIFRQLGAASILPSNRTQARCINVAQATAWMEGAAEAGREHLDMLVHVLWNHPDQRRDVQRIVYGVCSPGRLAAEKLSDALAKLAVEVDAAIALPIRVDDDRHPGETKANDEKFALIAEHNTNLGRLIDAIEDQSEAAGGKTLQFLADLYTRAEALGDRLEEEGLMGGRKRRNRRAA